MKRKSLIALAVAVLLVVVLQPTFAAGTGLKDVIVHNTADQPVPVSGVVTQAAETVLLDSGSVNFIAPMIVDVSDSAAIRINAEIEPFSCEDGFFVVESEPFSGFRIDSFVLDEDDGFFVSRVIELPGTSVSIRPQGDCTAEVEVYGRPN